MEIITAAFATAVAAFCFLAIVKNDLKERAGKRTVSEVDTTTAN